MMLNCTQVLTCRALLPIVPVLLCLSPPIVAATSTVGSTDDWTEERERFVEARAALAIGERETFEKLMASLTEYPLHPYLQADALLEQWRDGKPGKADVAALNMFEKASGDDTLTARLTRMLQRRLAATDQWHTFLGVSKSRLAGAMPCATLRARAETDQLEGFDEAAVALWVKPVKHDALCADLLVQLEEAEAPPVVAIWERIYQSMEANKPDYAEAMLGYLASVDRKRVRRWIEAIDKPQDMLTSGELDQDTVLNRRIIADLLERWSNEDPVAAMEHWMDLRGNYTFYKDRYYDTHRSLAMRGAYRQLPEAYEWLDAIEAREDDLELQEWRVRAALLAQDWVQVMRSIYRLPEEEQEEDHWAYWVARALETAGHLPEANTIYQELSELQSYHGFLAADRLGLDYSIRDEPITADPAVLALLASNDQLIRAREYHAVELPWEGRREWNSWLGDKTEDEMGAAAVLADQWGLSDRAIFSAGQADAKRALSLRFPVLYRSEVANAARDNRIEPAWIFGVMRRESAYIADVQSGAGAVGLMQLMPNTAKYVAKLQGNKRFTGDLKDAGTNIGLGSFYLRYVMDKFDNNQVLATASYNAGPRRVGIWVPDVAVEADIWIDTIPYTETRRYVRAVLAYTTIYEWQLTQKPLRLATKLRPIGGGGSDPDKPMKSQEKL